MLTVLMGGDVMLGRAVDQILPHPGDPALNEPWLRDARRYIELAEGRNGPIERPVEWAWPWGEVPALLDELAPDLRVINLETTITVGGDFAPHKTVHYRMNPANLSALTAFRPDVCALANNHILDFGRRGLTDTLEALQRAGITAVGAGADLPAATRPAVVGTGPHRVVVGSVAATSSGVPESWAAGRDQPGLWLIPDLGDPESANQVAAAVAGQKAAGDIAVVSVHWGPNWNYAVTNPEQQFAHRLIDAGVDIVHGHSSHHPRPIEIYRGRPILYGCGDVIDDYEGIRGHEPFRPELRLLYLAASEPTGELAWLRLIPLRVRRMRLERATRDEAEWLCATVARISRRFDATLRLRADDLLHMESAQRPAG